ncbi:MAG: hypothetical protein ABI775_10905 [Pseudonocardiales bacterium]
MRTAIAVVAAGVVGVLVGSVVSQAGDPPGPHQQAQLAGRSVLAASANRAGSAPSGAFLSAADKQR